MAAKGGDAGMLFDIVSIRQELDVLTRIVAETSGAEGVSLPEARFSALVGQHIRGARAAIPLSAEETERRIRELVDVEISRAFSESMD